jgi:hypothetical protein
MSLFAFISDVVVFAYRFWSATLDLYMALANSNGSRPNTHQMLGHFVVMVAFLTVTLPIDALIGSSFLYSLTKIIFLFYLVHGNYRGSKRMFQLCVESLIALYPQVLDFADNAHQSQLAQDVKVIGTAVLGKFTAEYQEIFDSIEVQD